MVYVGVDLHRKSSHVAVLAGDGELLASRRIASRPEEFLRVLGELEPGPVEVAFEATYGWVWFADLLADVGIPAHMPHPPGPPGGQPPAHRPALPRGRRGGP